MFAALDEMEAYIEPRWDRPETNLVIDEFVGGLWNLGFYPETYPNRVEIADRGIRWARRFAESDRLPPERRAWGYEYWMHFAEMKADTGEWLRAAREEIDRLGDWSIEREPYALDARYRSLAERAPSDTDRYAVYREWFERFASRPELLKERWCLRSLSVLLSNWQEALVQAGRWDDWVAVDAYWDAYPSLLAFQTLARGGKRDGSADRPDPAAARRFEARRQVRHAVARMARGDSAGAHRLIDEAWNRLVENEVFGFDVWHAYVSMHVHYADSREMGFPVTIGDRPGHVGTEVWAFLDRAPSIPFFAARPLTLAWMRAEAMRIDRADPAEIVRFLRAALRGRGAPPRDYGGRDTTEVSAHWQLQGMLDMFESERARRRDG